MVPWREVTLWWAGAAVAKEDYFLGDSAKEKALAIAADLGVFPTFHVVAGLGTVVATVGMVLLSRWLRSRRPSRLVDAAAAAGLVGTAAWLVEIGIRLTFGVDRAEAVGTPQGHALRGEIAR